MNWLKRLIRPAPPKFSPGDRVAWQVIEGSHFYPCTVKAHSDRGYLVEADVRPGMYEFAREKELRAVPKPSAEQP